MKPKQSVQYTHLQGPSYTEIIMYISILYSPPTHTHTHVFLVLPVSLHLILAAEQYRQKKREGTCIRMGCWVRCTCLLEGFSEKGDSEQSQDSGVLLPLTPCQPCNLGECWVQLPAELIPPRTKGLTLSPSCCQSLREKA